MSKQRTRGRDTKPRSTAGWTAEKREAAKWISIGFWSNVSPEERFARTSKAGKARKRKRWTAERRAAHVERMKVKYKGWIDGSIPCSKRQAMKLRSIGLWPHVKIVEPTS